MIVTIDGPAGAGKSTVARRLAERLRFEYLDTGAMYRAVALAGLRQGIDWSHPEQLAQLARRLSIEATDTGVRLDGEDVSDLVRSSKVTAVTRFAAGNPEVRSHLVQLQQRLAVGRDMVTEGRDQGTVAFPDAGCKIFLTASPEERARRRLRDLHGRGEEATLEKVRTDQDRRDREDSAREVGPLVAAPDAVEVPTDGLTIEQIVDRLEAMVRERMMAGQ